MGYQFTTGLGEKFDENQEKKSKDNHESRNLKITQLLNFVIENAKSENELMIVIGQFFKAYKKEIEEFNTILDHINKKIEEFRD